MAENDRLVVELCMGSSCFARGNSAALAEIENYIETDSLQDRVELVGHLCLEKCNSGPHIMVGGKSYSGITDPESVIDLIRTALEAGDAEPDIH